MKRITVISILLALCCIGLSWANVDDGYQVPVKRHFSKVIDVPEHLINASESFLRSKDVPEWEFITAPEEIRHLFEYYMPGNYDGHPLKLQPLGNTCETQGLYFVYAGVPSDEPGTQKRVHWAYVSEDGNINSGSTITTLADHWECYPGLAIHPKSGSAIATWHRALIDPLEVYLNHDEFDMFGMCMPGFWNTDGPMEIPQTHLPDNYIWPYVYVGPSPIEGYIRLYHLSHNYVNNSAGHPSENALLMYIDVPNEDYEYGDLPMIIDIENWSEVIVFYDWREFDIRPLWTFAVSWDEPGKVAFFGDAAYLSPDEMPPHPPVPDGFYVWESYDYGVTWDYANLHSYPKEIPGPNGLLYTVDNPGYPYIDEETGEPYEFVGTTCTGHHYAALYDGEGNLHLGCPLQIVFIDPADGKLKYFEYYQHIFQADVVYKTDGTWEIHTLPMPGIDPRTGHGVPWIITETDTIVYEWMAMPCSDQTAQFHENLQFQAVNKEYNLMAQVWTDGTKLLQAENGTGDLNYLGHPIIHICVSKDNGQTWSDPIELSDIYSPGWEDQVTFFAYICDEIKFVEDSDGHWGQIFMYYMNDDAYILHPQSHEGDLTYLSLKIHFDYQAVDEPHPVLPALSLSNYPNPFNTFTNISFSAPRRIINSLIEIYNVKGQLVSTLKPSIGSTPSEGYAIWDGKDSNNNDVANGIYFYKLFAKGGSAAGGKTDYGAVTRKMLLVR